jgi:hypothetical protein
MLKARQIAGAALIVGVTGLAIWALQRSHTETVQGDVGTLDMDTLGDLIRSSDPTDIAAVGGTYTAYRATTGVSEIRKPAPPAGGAPDWPQIESALESPDADVRRRALESLLNTDPYEEPVVDAVVTGLADSDDGVRRAAASVVEVAASVQRLTVDGGAAPSPDLAMYPPLRDALVGALSDPNPSVQRCAAQAISYVLPASSGIETAVVSAADGTSDPSALAVLLVLVGEHGYTSAAVEELLHDSADHPEPDVRGAAAMTMAASFGQTSLPWLEDMLAVEGDSIIRTVIQRAIAVASE